MKTTVLFTLNNVICIYGIVEQILNTFVTYLVQTNCILPLTIRLAMASPIALIKDGLSEGSRLNFDYINETIRDNAAKF